MAKLPELPKPTLIAKQRAIAAIRLLGVAGEADFLDTSFGFRPERSAEQALRAIRGHLDNGYREVYDADLKGYFDTIPHDQLMLALKMRIADKAVLHLIELWLKCEMIEIDENGKTHMTRSKTGTPQGGVVSPLLSNVYLHWFEHAFHRETGPAHWAKAKIVRYADDFVILARYQGVQLQGWIEQTLETRFKLTINREKTKVVKLGQPGSSLDFLGYTFRYDMDLKGRAHRYLNIAPSRKAKAKARAAIRDLTRRQRCFMPVVAMIAEINQWQTGWTNYFGYGYPRVAFRAVHAYTVARLTNHLRRRSQRAYRPPAGKSFYAHVHDLGLRRP